MATITPQSASLAGVTPTYNTASTGGDKVAVSRNERTYIHVKNAAASPITLTIALQSGAVQLDDVGLVTPSDISVSVPATTGEKIIGPIPNAYIGSDGNANLAWSSNTSVTFAAITVPALSRGYM